MLQSNANNENQSLFTFDGINEQSITNQPEISTSDSIFTFDGMNGQVMTIQPEISSTSDGLTNQEIATSNQTITLTDPTLPNIPDDICNDPYFNSFVDSLGADNDSDKRKENDIISKDNDKDDDDDNDDEDLLHAAKNVTTKRKRGRPKSNVIHI